MTIQEIKELAAREGSVQIIVTFLDEETVTVGVKIQKEGFGWPTYGDYASLGPEEHMEEKIWEVAGFLAKQLGDALNGR